MYRTHDLFLNCFLFRYIRRVNDENECSLVIKSIMAVVRWKSWKGIATQFSLLGFHCSVALLVLFIASVISYRLPYALLFNLKHLVFEYAPIDSIREDVISQHKQAQQIALNWLENVANNPDNYPHLISNSTHQFHSYDYLEFSNDHLSAYRLFQQPKQFISKSNDHIVISILYSKQNSDYHEGKFYIGQVLHQLLKNVPSRFLITLCENNNTDENASDEIELLRQLLPVFVIDTNTKIILDPYEREKQAHLQCILANFQSFPNINHLVLLQDDAEPISDQFYYQLSSLIDRRIRQQWPLNGQRKQPAFIKLYHPRWLIGYMNSSVYLLTQLLATCFLITFILYFTLIRVRNTCINSFDLIVHCFRKR